MYSFTEAVFSFNIKSTEVFFRVNSLVGMTAVHIGTRKVLLC